MFIPIALMTAAAAGKAPVAFSSQTQRSVTLSPEQMFNIAEAAQRRGDVATAEAIYRALTADRTVELRNEARYRLAILYEGEKRYSQAAILLRRILDEQPAAQPVRLELAKLLALLGDDSAARRELRAVRAGGLPPNVAQLVDRFSAALRARKKFGGSINVALASDSNINRATRSDTLTTAIGDFVLDRDAKARSGRGLDLEGQVYRRLPVSPRSSILVSLSESGDFYGAKRFDDFTVVAEAGPELQFGDNRVNLGAQAARRWYGGAPYLTYAGIQAVVMHPLSSTAQLKVTGEADRVRNQRDPFETGRDFSGTANVEKALSQRIGGGIAVSGNRRIARAAGYSTTSGLATIFGYFEAKRMTIAAAASISRLVADQHLFLFPARRSDWMMRGTLAATFRHATVHGLAPTLRLTVERNRSSVELYDFRRMALELGVSRAF